MGQVDSSLDSWTPLSNNPPTSSSTEEEKEPAGEYVTAPHAAETLVEDSDSTQTASSQPSVELGERRSPRSTRARSLRSNMDASATPLTLDRDYLTDSSHGSDQRVSRRSKDEKSGSARRKHGRKWSTKRSNHSPVRDDLLTEDDDEYARSKSASYTEPSTPSGWRGWLYSSSSWNSLSTSHASLFDDADETSESQLDDAPRHVEETPQKKSSSERSWRAYLMSTKTSSRKSKHKDAAQNASQLPGHSRNRSPSATNSDPPPPRGSADVPHLAAEPPDVETEAIPATGRQSPGLLPEPLGAVEDTPYPITTSSLVLTSTKTSPKLSPKFYLRRSTTNAKKSPSSSPSLRPHSASHASAADVDDHPATETAAPQLPTDLVEHPVIPDLNRNSSKRRVGSLKQSVSRIQGKLLSMLGASSESARRQWVLQVTNRHATPPSAKYLRKLVMLSWETHGASIGEFYNMLEARPVYKEPTCALKSMITCLRLLQHGPVESLHESFKYVPFVDLVGAAWAQKLIGDQMYELASSEKEGDLGKMRFMLLIARLSAIIVQKQHFHKSYPLYDARFDIITPVGSKTPLLPGASEFRDPVAPAAISDVPAESSSEDCAISLLPPNRPTKAGELRSYKFFYQYSRGTTPSDQHVAETQDIVELEKLPSPRNTLVPRNSDDTEEPVTTEDNEEETFEREVQMASRMLTLLGTIDGIVRLALGLEDSPTAVPTVESRTSNTSNVGVDNVADDIGGDADTASSHDDRGSTRPLVAEPLVPQTSSNTAIGDGDEPDVGIANQMVHNTLPRSAVGAVVPLIEEGYNIFSAVSELLIHLIPLPFTHENIASTRETQSGDSEWGTEMRNTDEHLLRSLLSQYNTIFEAMKEYFHAASNSPSLVEWDKVIPILPSVSPLKLEWDKKSAQISTSRSHGVVAPNKYSLKQHVKSKLPSRRRSMGNSSAVTSTGTTRSFRRGSRGEPPTKKPEVGDGTQSAAATPATTSNNYWRFGRTHAKQPAKMAQAAQVLTENTSSSTSTNTRRRPQRRPVSMPHGHEKGLVQHPPSTDQHSDMDESRRLATSPQTANPAKYAFATKPSRRVMSKVGSMEDIFNFLKQEEEIETRHWQANSTAEPTEEDVGNRVVRDADVSPPSAGDYDLAGPAMSQQLHFDPFNKDNLPGELLVGGGGATADPRKPPVAEGFNVTQDNSASNPFASLTNPFTNGFASNTEEELKKLSMGKYDSEDNSDGGGNGDDDDTTQAGHLANLPSASFRSMPFIDHQNQRKEKAKAIERAVEQCVRSFEVSGVVISSDEIVLGKMIGRGAFAMVYRAEYRSMEVAVKELQLKEWGDSPQAIHDFRAEMSLMKAMHHPNILELIGACTRPTLCLISEFCHRGNLLDLLHADRSHTTKGKVPSPLSWVLRVHLAMDEARGMKFLHTAFPTPLIHRDLKSPNLLITQSWTLKISDFGLSRFRQNTIQSMLTGQCGTYHWMAPEVMENRSYNESADVYSFGINLWELATRRIPYLGLEPIQVATKVAGRGERPSLDAQVLDEHCPPALVTLIEKCWHQDPLERPGFPQIVRELKAIAKVL